MNEENPIQDLIEMATSYETPNFQELLKTAYIRGFNEGVRITKKLIIEKIKE